MFFTEQFDSGLYPIICICLDTYMEKSNYSSVRSPIFPIVHKSHKYCSLTTPVLHLKLTVVVQLYSCNRSFVKTLHGHVDQFVFINRLWDTSYPDMFKDTVPPGTVLKFYDLVELCTVNFMFRIKNDLPKTFQNLFTTAFRKKQQ